MGMGRVKMQSEVGFSFRYKMTKDPVVPWVDHSINGRPVYIGIVTGTSDHAGGRWPHSPRLQSEESSPVCMV